MTLSFAATPSRSAVTVFVFHRLFRPLLLLLTLLVVGCGGGGSKGPGDTTPNAFSFTAQTDVALDTPITSNAITVSGIDRAASISISGGQYAIDNGSYQSGGGTVNNGQSVRVRLQSSGLPETTSSATLTIGGVSASFSVTTEAADTTPNAFSFVDRDGVFFNIPITSAPVTITGINQPSAISIEGGEYAIGAGDFTDAPGSISNHQTVRIRVHSSPNLGASTQASLSIGGVSASFSVTTYSVDPGGLYSGTGSVNTDTALADLKGMAYQDRFMVFSVAANLLYDGRIQTLADDQITAQVDVYKDGQNLMTVSATGTVSSYDTLTLTLAGNGYGGGSLSLTYDVLYERGATFGRFGTVSPPDIWVGNINTVTAGSIMGMRPSATDNTIPIANTSNPTPCDYQQGIKEIPDPSVNMYELFFNVVQGGVRPCNHIGTHFTGFAAIVDGGARGTDGIMWFAISNGTYSNFSILEYLDN